MSLPVSKLVWGIGDAPVTGAWMPMTISLSVIPDGVVRALRVGRGRARAAAARRRGRGSGAVARTGGHLAPGDSALLPARGGEQHDDEHDGDDSEPLRHGDSLSRAFGGALASRRSARVTPPTRRPDERGSARDPNANDVSNANASTSGISRYTPTGWLPTRSPTLAGSAAATSAEADDRIASTRAA